MSERYGGDWVKSDSFHAKVTAERVKVSIRMQQRNFVFDAIGCDQAVNRLADGYSHFPQGAKVDRALNRQMDIQHVNGFEG